MTVWIAGSNAYIDPSDLRGEAFWIDSAGRIGIDQDQDGRITWCAVRRDILVPVEIAPPTPAQLALLDLVSFSGSPGSQGADETRVQVGCIVGSRGCRPTVGPSRMSPSPRER